MDQISYVTHATVESLEALAIVETSETLDTIESHETLDTVESLETSNTSFENVDNQALYNDTNTSKSINSIENDFSVKIRVNEDEKRQKKRECNRKYYEKRKLFNEKVIGRNSLIDTQIKSQRNRKYYQKNKKDICAKVALFRQLHLEYARQYRASNPEQISEYAREYRVSHREEVSEYAREYRVSHREEVSEYAREYRVSHREEFSEYDREYRALNQDVISAYARDYRRSNREEITEYARIYYASNREEIRERENFYTVATYLQDIKKDLPTFVLVVEGYFSIVLCLC